MIQNAHDTVRKTIEIDVELAKTIKEMADRRFWSFSKMSYVLLQQSVKEKTRKHKIAVNKEDNS